MGRAVWSSARVCRLLRGKPVGLPSPSQRRSAPGRRPCPCRPSALRDSIEPARIYLCKISDCLQLRFLAAQTLTGAPEPSPRLALARRVAAASPDHEEVLDKQLVARRPLLATGGAFLRRPGGCAPRAARRSCVRPQCQRQLPTARPAHQPRAQRSAPALISASETSSRGAQLRAPLACPPAGASQPARLPTPPW